ncbi:MAG: hypothetical protein JXM69_14270 [Anaerolineae bacterium]|nr:hypothetical protein [Anaerolineae bacterium]
MITHNLSQSEVNNKIQVIERWQQSIRDALEALFLFRGYLQVWRDFPGPVDDDLFMGVVLQLRQIGLESWLDENKASIDALREVVTGVEI